MSWIISNIRTIIAATLSTASLACLIIGIAMSSDNLIVIGVVLILAYIFNTLCKIFMVNDL